MSYSVDFGRHLRPSLRFGLIGTLQNEKFRVGGLDTDDYRAEANLDWRFGRHVGMQFRVERSRRSSSNGIGQYTENRAYLGFTFSGDRVPAPATGIR